MSPTTSIALLVLLTAVEANAEGSLRRSGNHAATHNRRELVSRSTTYCYDLEYYLALGLAIPPSVGMGLPGCETPQPTNAPACSLSALNPGAMCRCSGGTMSCDIHSDTMDGAYQVAYCTQKTVYVQGGGSSQTMTEYCAEHVLLDRWEGRSRPSNRPETTWSSWYWPCWVQRGWSWRDGACRSTTRYLGESCWDGGECQNENVPAYDGYRLSCSSGGGSSPRCIPSVLSSIERNQCTCAWFDWWLFVACGSNDCNGHACVLSTGDGNHYCDYQTDGNWRR